MQQNFCRDLRISLRVDCEYAELIIAGLVINIVIIYKFAIIRLGASQIWNVANDFFCHLKKKTTHQAYYCEFLLM